MQRAARPCELSQWLNDVTSASTIPDEEDRAGLFGCAGFSFIEMMVVMAMLAVITAAIVPVYSSAMTGLRSRNQKNDLTALVYYVQQQAIVAGCEHRIYFDDDESEYFVARWVGMDDDEKEFEQVPEAWAEKRALPENLSFDKLPRQKDKQFKLPYLAFYPNGACDRAEIRVKDDRGREGTFSIETLGVLGKLEVKEYGSSRVIR
ncbi:MAG: prepilin-type N-terminal cleavage/methylation domain-containing protein [Candidatus Hydrogenedentes bacterium]|nr:prepilin-type N-terminal cleavage/methylation domain-containing protein [Candidatus Hydrogenedentota bacterium]